MNLVKLADAWEARDFFVRSIFPYFPHSGMLFPIHAVAGKMKDQH